MQQDQFSSVNVVKIAGRENGFASTCNIHCWRHYVTKRNRLKSERKNNKIMLNVKNKGRSSNSITSASSRLNLNILWQKINYLLLSRGPVFALCLRASSLSLWSILPSSAKWMAIWSTWDVCLYVRSCKVQMLLRLAAHYNSSCNLALILLQFMHKTNCFLKFHQNLNLCTYLKVEPHNVLWSMWIVGS